MIGDSVTKPLTNDPIQGKIVLKINGIDRADNSEKNIKAVVTTKYFFLIRKVKAMTMKAKMDMLTVML